MYDYRECQLLQSIKCNIRNGTVSIQNGNQIDRKSYGIMHLEIRFKFDYCQNISFLKKCRKMVRLHSSNDQKLHKNRQNTWNSKF